MAVLVIALSFDTCYASNQHREQVADKFVPILPTDETIRYPLAGCAAEFPINPVNSLLPVPHLVQRAPYIPLGQSNLCWATCIAMVSSDLGNPREACQIASYIADTSIDCCTLTKDSPQLTKDVCNKGAYAFQIHDTLHQMGIYSQRRRDILLETEIQSELSNGRPIMMEVYISRRIQGQQVIAGHVVVITGFEHKPDMYVYHVQNPNREPTAYFTYAQLVHSTRESWDWVGTWYHFSYRQDGCNPLFRTDCECKK